MEKGLWQSTAHEVTEELDTTWRLNSNKISYCAWAISCSGSVVQSIFQDLGDFLDPGMVASPQAGGLNSLPLQKIT